mmetsp:Transcript_116356/g.323398  ORF Transcript_116356/g.323398 Transcript_116356/m.323398 type:complete len:225 (+) Transcript_116356:59-733(+)
MRSGRGNKGAPAVPCPHFPVGATWRRQGRRSARRTRREQGEREEYSTPANDQGRELVEGGARGHPSGEQVAVLRRVERKLPQQRCHPAELLGRALALPIDVCPALTRGEERPPPAPHLVFEQPEDQRGKDLLLRAAARDRDVPSRECVGGVREAIQAHARRVPFVVAGLHRNITVFDEAAVLAHLLPVLDEYVCMPARQDDPPVVLHDVVSRAANLRGRPLVWG